MANSIDPTANIATMDHILQRLNIGLGFDGYVKDDYIQYMNNKSFKLQKLTIRPIHKAEPNFAELLARQKFYIPLREKRWGGKRVLYHEEAIFLEYGRIGYEFFEAVGTAAGMIIGGFVKVEKDGDRYYVKVSVTRDAKNNTYLDMQGDVNYVGQVYLYMGSTQISNDNEYILEPLRRDQHGFYRREWKVLGSTAFELPSWADQNIYVRIKGGWMLDKGYAGEHMMHLTGVY